MNFVHVGVSGLLIVLYNMNIRKCSEYVIRQLFVLQYQEKCLSFLNMPFHIINNKPQIILVPNVSPFNST